MQARKSALLVCLIAFAACNKSTPTTPAAKVPPVIVSFAATPEELEYRSSQKSVLSWSVTGASDVSINQGVGGVGQTGTVEVQPSADTTYTLTASNADGQITRSVTVKIKARAIFELVSYNYGKTSYGCCRITGTAKNVGNADGYNVMITFTAYNASNVIIDTANGFPANLDRIPVMIEAAFEAVFFDVKSWSLISRMTYEISWLTVRGELMKQRGGVFIPLE